MIFGLRGSGLKVPGLRGSGLRDFDSKDFGLMDFDSLDFGLKGSDSTGSPSGLLVAVDGLQKGYHCLPVIDLQISGTQTSSGIF